MSVTRVAILVLVLVGALTAVSYAAIDPYLFDVDLTPPIVQITQPGNWETNYTGQPNVQITGTAADESEVVYVRWENQFGQYGDCTGTTSWNFGQLLREGLNYIYVTAEDSAGNVGSASVLISYTPTVTASPPVVTSITPNAATNTGSINTTITGTGFTSGLTVKLTKTGQNNIVAANVRVLSNNEITCTFPLLNAATGSWNVVVTNPDNQYGSLLNAFIVNKPAPTITSVKPNSELNIGRMNISSINGTGFVPGATVRLTKTGQPAITGTSVSVLSSSRISCVMDLSGVMPGAWSVVVTNPDGQSASLVNGFMVKAMSPVLIGITPNSAYNTSPVNSTNLSGIGLLKGATVRLKKSGSTDIIATNVVVMSSSSLTCTLPLAGSTTGEWDVVVTNPDNQSASLLAAFTIKSSTLNVTSITPNTGVNTETVSISDLAGQGFVSGTSVKLTRTGCQDIPASQIAVVSSGNITCSIPIIGASEGAWNVVVTNPDGKSVTLANAFTITDAALKVTSITPNTCVQSGVVAISDISGAGFKQGATVKLTKSGQTDIVGTAVTVASSSSINCSFALSKAAPGAWNVVVTNPDGKTATLSSAFTVSVPSLTVNSITLNTALNAGKTYISNLAGTGFVDGLSVFLSKDGETDVTATDVTVVSSTKITCVLPLSGVMTGEWDVTVKNSDGSYAVLSKGFKVTAMQPVPIGITPNNAPNTATATITNLTGIGYLRGATVKLTRSGQKDILAENVDVVNSSSISCLLPVKGALMGKWNVVVTNPDGQSAILANAFTVTDAYTITGSVNLLDYSASPEGTAVDIELSSDGEVVQKVTTQLNTLGEYTVVNVLPGNYKLRVKAAKWLSNTSSFTVTNRNVVLHSVDLVNGDIDNNNAVNSLDRNLLEATFQKQSTESDATADLNGDGVVNDRDREIIERNLGKKGN